MNKYTIKRELFRATGLLRYKWNRLAPGVYVFNYHRIGNRDSTEFDPNVFSCDVPKFRTQIETIASRFRIIDIQQLTEIIASRTHLEEPVALITFDDGYKDNYLNALPVLESCQATAVFFLPTNYIGSTIVPWWDEVAWTLRHCKVNEIQLQGWEQAVVLQKENIARSIREILTRIKRQRDVPISDKLAQLRAQCGCTLDPQASHSLFMSWDDVRDMLDRGMDIGSHTTSHQILSHLDIEEQKKELATSKAIIEQQVGRSIQAFAYPVGGKSSFTPQTCTLVEECGYTLAFTFITGFNPDPSLNPYTLLRIPAEDYRIADLKYLTVNAKPLI